MLYFFFEILMASGFLALGIYLLIQFIKVKDIKFILLCGTFSLVLASLICAASIDAVIYCANIDHLEREVLRTCEYSVEMVDGKYYQVAKNAEGHPSIMVWAKRSDDDSAKASGYAITDASMIQYNETPKLKIERVTYDFNGHGPGETQLEYIFMTPEAETIIKNNSFLSD